MKPESERFWTKVRKDGPVPAERSELGPCWEWVASLTHLGYGQFSVRRNGKRTHITAHRWAYEAAFGPPPLGWEPHHLCRNRKCVNPSHLEAMSHRDNVRQNAALRHKSATCRHGHEWTDENTYVDPAGKRHCRQCNAAAVLRHGRRYRAEQTASAASAGPPLEERLREAEADRAFLLRLLASFSFNVYLVAHSVT